MLHVQSSGGAELHLAACQFLLLPLRGRLLPRLGLGPSLQCSQHVPLGDNAMGPSWGDVLSRKTVDQQQVLGRRAYPGIAFHCLSSLGGGLWSRAYSIVQERLCQQSLHGAAVLAQGMSKGPASYYRLSASFGHKGAEALVSAAG